MPLTDFSFAVQNYKSFGEQFVGFDSLRPINLIIGRNNTGKSALLDLVAAMCSQAPELDPVHFRQGRDVRFRMSAVASDSICRRVFPDNVSGGLLDGRGSHWALVGQKYSEKRLTWDQPNKARINGRTVEQSRAETRDEPWMPPWSNSQNRINHENLLVQQIESPLSQKTFRRMAAERDVQPEADDPNALDPQPNGRNVTNLIQRLYNEASFDYQIVREQFLKELNKVVAPDYSFSEIAVRRVSNGSYEVFLSDRNRPLVSLSASGSGLKTIVATIAHIWLWPKIIAKRDLTHFIFGLEELENNLHPAMLRRLLEYVATTIVEGDSHVVLTTHSNVAIDMLASNQHAQIIHTSLSSGGETTVRIVDEYLHKQAVLNDLDVRASDLLQANGVVWVEGPSDRTYLNHWINLHSNGELKEGTHYQCVFYGGRLLSRLSASDPSGTDLEEAVSILRVNRNSAVLIDSDIKTVGGQIGKTKKRIVSEVEKLQGFVWVTKGREIENYLPKVALDFASGLNTRPLELYEDIGVMLEAIETGAGKKFERSKSEFAARAVEKITAEDMEGMLDWKTQISDLCAAIRRWNNLKSETEVSGSY